ncbi:MAG: head GIN domain-containing protein [Bacteroidia bacterium]
MKRIFIASSLVLALLNATLAPAMASQPIVIGVSRFIKQDREVRNFNGIALAGPIHVVVTIGSTESLRFEGDADAISTLITEVKGNILVIRPQNSWTSWMRKYNGKKITAYVSAKAIRNLTSSSSGSITVNGKIKGSELITTLSGSGSISADAEVENYTGVISGSGSLNIAGAADNASIVLSGSGSFAKKGFTVSSVSAVISGSGSINVNATAQIEAVVSGSGSINYSGNAKVEKRVTGSGRVRKV